MKSVSVFIFSLILAAGFGLGACSRSDNVEAGREPGAVDRANDLTADDRLFIEYAAGMHVGEVKLAELAKQKSSREDLKDYADDVIASHSDALRKLSQRTGQDLTLDNTNASDDTRSHAEYLSSLSGMQFDQDFIALMIADHKDAAGAFQTPFVPVQSNQLRNYMKDEIPALEENQRRAEKLNN